MRRSSALGVLLAAAMATCAICVACASALAGCDDASTGSSSSQGDSGDLDGGDAGSPSALKPIPCLDLAAADTFDALPGNPPWSLFQDGGASVGIGTLRSVGGGDPTSALLARAPGLDAGSTRAYLSRDVSSANEWSFCMTFRMQIVEAPVTGRIEGPRVIGWDRTMPEHQSLQLAVTRDGVSLRQTGVGSCPGTCGTATMDLGTYEVGTWYPVRLALRADPGRKRPPYGEVEISFGTAVARDSLTVALADLVHREVDIGVTYAASASGIVAFDDLQLRLPR